MRARLKVTPIPGELTRFFVSSQREDEGVPEYLVDLSALNGAGCCACEHYEFRIYPKIKAQQHLPWDQIRPMPCVHLLDAREYFLQEVLHRISEHNHKLAEEHKTIGTGEPPKKQAPETRSGFFQKMFHWRSKEP